MQQIEVPQKKNGLAKLANIGGIAAGVASGGVTGAISAGAGAASMLADKQAQKQPQQVGTGDALQRHLDKLNAMRYQGG